MSTISFGCAWTHNIPAANKSKTKYFMHAPFIPPQKWHNLAQGQWGEESSRKGSHDWVHNQWVAQMNIEKPLKRFRNPLPSNTWLKPGVNETVASFNLLLLV